MPVDARQQIYVSRDERTLRNDRDGETRVIGEHLEYSPRDAEFSFGGLIGIGCGSDHDRLAVEESEVLFAALSERARENFGRVLLDENVALESEPGRHLRITVAENALHAVVVGGALHHISMRVAGVAVSAAE